MPAVQQSTLSARPVRKVQVTTDSAVTLTPQLAMSRARWHASRQPWKRSTATKHGCCTTSPCLTPWPRLKPGVAGTLIMAQSQVMFQRCHLRAACRQSARPRKQVCCMLSCATTSQADVVSAHVNCAHVCTQAAHFSQKCAGLTSSMYLPAQLPPDTAAHELAAHELDCPNDTIGLHVRKRNGQVVRVTAPRDQLMFQAGQCLEILSGGRLRATEHYVRGPGGPMPVSRSTFAVFCQPKCVPHSADRLSLSPPVSQYLAFCCHEPSHK